MLRIRQQSLLPSFIRHQRRNSRIPSLTSFSTQQYQDITIDDIKLRTKIPPADSHLVPHRYVDLFGKEGIESNEILAHLRWMAQKYALGQDLFLCGHSTSLRRQLAFAFAELCQLEVEYLSLSKDTTESDLKQRKEIIEDSVIYHDQAPVRAAIHGRLLIIDGIEKAERNVLPTLNNLLENREMALEDGRFLTIHAFEHNNANPEKATIASKLVPIHPNFRVIALGVPVPPYPGRTLDPPLRSRFQARFIDELQTSTLLQIPRFQSFLKLNNTATTTNTSSMQALLQFYESMQSIKQQAVQESLPLGDVPQFSMDSLYHCLQLLQRFEGQVSVAESVKRTCPAVDSLHKFVSPRFSHQVKQIHSAMPRESNNTLTSKTNEPTPIELVEKLTTSNKEFATLLSSQKQVLANLLTDLTSSSSDNNHVRHVCLLGHKGEGKSYIASALSSILQTSLRSFPLYQELTSRDLLQRRCTNTDGNQTTWIDSPLIAAARVGDLCVLDSIHRIDAQALATLTRLLVDQEIDLPNGERLVAHPSFRVLALGEVLDNRQDIRDRFFINDLGFSFHSLPSLSASNNGELQTFVTKFVTSTLPPNSPQLSQALAFGQQLITAHSNLLNHASDQPSLHLSLRHILRIMKSVCYPGINFANELEMKQFLIQSLENSLLIPFSPHKKIFHQAMLHAGITGTFVKSNHELKNINAKEVEVHVDHESKTLQIGDLVVPQRKPIAPENVPRPVFVHNALHNQILQRLARDYLIDQRAVLLIGNQGVGKNKLVDQFCHLLACEREYIQLHRDSSIHSLTVVPHIEAGIITYKDSPLIHAAKYGKVLIIDEVDKADTSVVCVLKALVEDGEVVLYDGRRLLSQDKLRREGYNTDSSSQLLPSSIIPIHPTFKLIVLANRPGFPFLGNHFFRECGDVFSTHIIPNLDPKSEATLLQTYGLDVNPRIIQALVRSFAALRAAHDDGSLQYPFSVREAVHVVRHLQEFPQDSLSDALTNILALDSLSPATYKMIARIFHHEGIPLANTPNAGNMKPTLALHSITNLPTPRVSKSSMKPISSSTSQSFPKIGNSHAWQKTPWNTNIQNNVAVNSNNTQSSGYDLISSRLSVFSEEIGRMSPSFSSGTKVTQMLASEKGLFCVLTVQPSISLHVFTSLPSTLSSHLAPEPNASDSQRCHHYVDLVSTDVLRTLGQNKGMPLMQLTEDGDKVSVIVPGLQRVFLVDLDWSNNAEVRSVDTYLDTSMTQLPGVGLQANDSGRGGGTGGGKFSWFPTSSTTGRDGSSGSTPAVSFQLSPIHGTSSALLSTSSTSSSTGTTTLLMNSGSLSTVALTVPNSSIPVAIHSDTTNGHAKLFLNIHSSNSKEYLKLDLLSFQNAWRIGSCHHLMFASSPNTGIATPTYSSAPMMSTVVEGGNTSEYLSQVNFASEDNFVEYKTWDRSQPAATVLQSHISPQFLYNLIQEKDGQTTLEAIDLQSQTLLKLPLTPSSLEANSTNKKSKHTGIGVTSICTIPHASITSSKGLLAVAFNSGDIVFYDVDQASLKNSLQAWQQMFRNPGAGSGQANTDKILSPRLQPRASAGISLPKTGLGDPKHGKEDPNNDPHVGGNTWAGGTGGSDTAGLGGRGGPYRLDKGHQVHQVPDHFKNMVSEEAKAKAREIAKTALAQRLQDIAMGKSEYEMYQVFRKRVEGDINQLKVVLEELSRRAKERIWLRHQSHGDLDDSKLVDGLTGDRLVFKRRGFPDQSTISNAASSSEGNKKRLHFVFDVSASMYRFNGEDRRLERVLEAALMIMESMPNSTAGGADNDIIEYAITGHSGDSPEIPFLSFFDKRPTNEKERLEILQEMAAHSQFTYAGDHTIEATKLAITNIINPSRTHSYRDRLRRLYHENPDAEIPAVDEESTTSSTSTSSSENNNMDHYVFVVSDANFDRYNIDPMKLAQLMKTDRRVKVHFILIASKDDEAKEIAKALPTGHGHLCFESTDLPGVFRKILSQDTFEMD